MLSQVRSRARRKPKGYRPESAQVETLGPSSDFDAIGALQSAISEVTQRVSQDRTRTDES